MPGFTNSTSILALNFSTLTELGKEEKSHPLIQSGFTEHEQIARLGVMAHDACNPALKK